MGAGFGYFGLFVTCMVFLSLMICCSCLCSCGYLAKKDDNEEPGFLIGMMTILIFTLIVLIIFIYVMKKTDSHSNLMQKFDDKDIGDN